LAESLAGLSRVCAAMGEPEAAVATMEECVLVSATLPRRDCPAAALIARRFELTRLLLRLGRVRPHMMRSATASEAPAAAGVLSAGRARAFM
jgi:hypothetical protein